MDDEIFDKINEFFKSECSLSDCKNSRKDITYDDMDYYIRVGRAETIVFVLDLFGIDIE